MDERLLEHEPECLHCQICKLITEHARACDERHNGKLVIDAVGVLASLAQVAGELIAAPPEKFQRKLLVKRLVEGVLAHVRKLRARGHQPTNVIIGGARLQ